MSTISVMAKAPVCGGICGGGLAHLRGEPNLFVNTAPFTVFRRIPLD